MPDLALLLGGLLIGWVLWRWRLGRPLESWFSRLANYRSLAVVLCAVVAMIPRLLLLPWLGYPEPLVQDEFSYLLGAQTLALGRLTNPTPAFWQHFESFHINLVPTYQSMYPPAPSLFYALGLAVGGNAWWGVCLSLGLMCAAICWALQPIVRPRYALLAGLVCALKYGVFTVFSDSYWGGPVAALGGALALGAFVRLVKSPKLSHAILLVLGVGVLANSRPYEGLLFTIPLAVAALLWIVKGRRSTSGPRWRELAVVAGLLGVMFAAMGYYNLRGTGHATQMPYMANFQQYHLMRPFVGAGVSPRPQYRHVNMEILYEVWEGQPGRMAHTASGLWHLTRQKFQVYYRRQFAPMLALALLGAFAALRSRRRLLAYTFLLVGVGLFAVVWRPLVTYPAPALVSFFGLAMLGIRRLRVAFRRKPVYGLAWSRGIMAGLLLFGLGLMLSNSLKGLKQTVVFPLPWNLERARLIHDLERRGGEHLVFVKYFPDHFIHGEWVYNSPQIERQKVILARSMSPHEDCELIERYAGRQVWLLEPDAGEVPTAFQPITVSPLAPKCR